MSPPSSSLSKITTTITNNFNHHNRKPSSNPNPNSSINNSSSSSSSSLPCQHSPFATLDNILILILVLFSGTFLISSYFSYIFHSLSPPPHHLSPSTPSISPLSISSPSPSSFFLPSISSFVAGLDRGSVRNWDTRVLKKAMEFNLQLQTEDCLESAGKAVKEVDQGSRKRERPRWGWGDDKGREKRGRVQQKGRLGDGNCF